VRVIATSFEHFLRKKMKNLSEKQKIPTGKWSLKLRQILKKTTTFSGRLAVNATTHPVRKLNNTE